MTELEEMDNAERQEELDRVMQHLVDYFETRPGWVVVRRDAEHAGRGISYIVFSTPSSRSRAITLESKLQRKRVLPGRPNLDPTIYVRANRYAFNEGLGERTAHFKLRSDGTFNVNGIIERALEWQDELQVIHEHRKLREQEREAREREVERQRQDSISRIIGELDDPEEIREIKPKDGTSFRVCLSGAVWAEVFFDGDRLWVPRLTFEAELTPEQALGAAEDLREYIGVHPGPGMNQE